MPVPLPPENQYGHTKKLRFLLEEIARHQAKVGRPVTLLDFGCGNGSAVSQYLMSESIHYYGVDLHEPSLAYARSHFGGANSKFLDRVPHGVRFDIIVYADVLEHVDDPVELLREHEECLAPDGIILGAVPNGYGPFEIERRLDRWLGLSRLLATISRLRRRMQGRPFAAPVVDLPYNHESGHVVFFTRRSLMRAVTDAGFTPARFVHGAFIGASVSGVFLSRFSQLLIWNTRVSDLLPYWAVSTWYFVLRRAQGRI